MSRAASLQAFAPALVAAGLAQLASLQAFAPALVAGKGAEICAPTLPTTAGRGHKKSARKGLTEGVQ